ncbi:Mobile element protein (plasmid) [Sinorhizobium sojae CCBAU 05684]|uniref:Mobile element protein n=1 Tax=Sinorhizobium sojae CCBAU 05684 TaxID=716928 RepID=A0A249PNE5_9HYPH|nr:Mobile element protein [Sinorhizobium sojae CCBAU 05684]AWI61887.1 hypothetical protein AB395_00004362 [Sinorhizobium fredii CCBAU 45436]AWM29809.1 Mobile element protein [Sinorhizobium fredii CCBAU 25509]
MRRRFDSLAKKPSTALSHEQDVGVKWKVGLLKKCYVSDSIEQSLILWSLHDARP